MLRTLTLTNLALLLFLTLFLLLLPSKASAEIECQIGISSGSVSWAGVTFGDKPYTCVRTCRYNLATVAVCFVNNGTCHGEFISNGNHCLNGAGQIDGSDGLRFGGNTVIPDPSADPDKPWDPNAPSPMPNKVQNVLNRMPTDTTSGRQQAQALKDMAFIEGMGVMTLDNILIKNSQLLDINKGYSSLMSTMSGQLYSIRNLSDYIEKNTAQTAAFSQMSANTLGNILNKLSDSGSGGGNSETYLKNISNAISNHFIGNSYSALAHLDNTVSRLDSVKRTLDDNYSSFTNYFAFRMDSLEKALSGIGGGGGDDVDLSGVESGIGSLNTGIDSVKSGIDNLNGLLGGNGLTKPGISSGVNFGEMPLYGSDSLAALNTEITELQKEYSEKIKDFRKLFSFDVSKLNTGEYKEHSLSFKFANGQETSIKSSVFPALVANAGLISSVILFLAALAGLRIVMGGGDK
ncbi:Phage protein [Vibrio cholerae]|nr:Phage protein [Vibrio cholerae]